MQPAGTAPKRQSDWLDDESADDGCQAESAPAVGASSGHYSSRRPTAAQTSTGDKLSTFHPRSCSCEKN